MIDKIKIISLDTIDVQSMTPIYERSKHWGNQDFSRWVFKDESTQLYYKIWNETYVRKDTIPNAFKLGFYDEELLPGWFNFLGGCL